MLNDLAEPEGGWIAHYAAVKARIAARAAAAAPPPPPAPALALPAPEPELVPEPALEPALEPAPEPAPPVWPYAPATFFEARRKNPRKSTRAKSERLRYEHAARIGNVRLPVEIRRRPDLRERVEEIMATHSVTWGEIVGTSRSKVYIPSRLAVYQLLVADGWSRCAIGRACRRDHTSILYYITKWGRS